MRNICVTEWDVWTVKLANWRKLHGLTQAALADELGCSQSYVSQIERADDPIVPGKDILARLYELSGGEVQPNDFYDLPDLNSREAA